MYIQNSIFEPVKNCESKKQTQQYVYQPVVFIEHNPKTKYQNQMRTKNSVYKNPVVIPRNINQ